MGERAFDGEIFDLTGKRALITGSSLGIGRALARGLAEHGANAVLNARDAVRLHGTAEAMHADGLDVAQAAFEVWRWRWRDR